MPNNWRFRTNLRGLLILQRLACRYIYGQGLEDYWRDARVEDIQEYFSALGAAKETDHG